MAAEKTEARKKLIRHLNELIDNLERWWLNSSSDVEEAPQEPEEPVTFVTRPLKFTYDGRVPDQVNLFPALPVWPLLGPGGCELRGGTFTDCSCWKRNGLQDSCPKRECRDKLKRMEIPLPKSGPPAAKP